MSYDEDYSAADARADDAQDRTDALHNEALDAYGTAEIQQAIGEAMNDNLLRLIRCGDKRAGAELLEILVADRELFCADWVEAEGDHRDYERELIAAAGRVL